MTKTPIPIEGPHGLHHGGHNKSLQWLNPPFAPETRTIGAPTSRSQDLYRGAIIADGNNVSGKPGKVRFMYNPSNLVVSHAVNNDYPVGEQKNKAEDVASATSPFGSIDTLSLLFDRTYELWSGQREKGSKWDDLSHGVGGLTIRDAQKRGVQVDVVALYRMFGLCGPNQWEPTYPLVPSGVNIVIGKGNRLKYYGVIAGMSVNYTSWTQDMTPRRCEVTLSFNLLSKNAFGSWGANKGGSDGSGNSLWDGIQNGAGSDSNGYNQYLGNGVYGHLNPHTVPK